MSNVHVGRDLTDQVISELESAGLTVGRAEAPASVPANTGYVIVYPITGGSFDGDIYDPHGEARADYQLTSVGTSAEQCEWVADKARETMIDASLTLTDRAVIWIDATFLGGVLRDDDVQPPLFYSPDRYTVWTGAA